VCKKNEESKDHLLLHREIAGALWYTIFNNIGLAWVMLRSVVNLFACCSGPGVGFSLMQFGR
jgi:hypothetical protein